MPNINPQPVPQTINTGQAEIIMSQADFLRNNPYYLSKFMNSYGGYTTFADKIRALGFAKSVPNSTPYSEHYFNNRESRTFTIGSVVTPAGGAGENIVVALSAGDMQTITGLDGTARSFSRPRETEVVQFPSLNNYQIVAKNKTTNPHQITLRPVNPAVNANTDITEDVKAFILAPMFAEATGQPQPVTNLYGKYRNTFATVKETSLASGTAITSKSPLASIDGMPGYWYLKDIQDATVRHQINKSKTLLHDQLGSNVTQFSPDFDENFTVSHTEGFIEHALTTGEQVFYSSLPAFDIDDFDDVAAYYRSVMANTRQLVSWQGAQYQARVENVLVDFLADSSFTDYVSREYMRKAVDLVWDDNVTNNDAFVQIGFRGVRKQGFDFLFSALNELNDVEGGGALGFDYPTWAFYLPLGFTKDAKNKTNVPFFQLEHRGQTPGGFQREDILWNTGGPVAHTDQFDVHRSYFLSEILIHIANGDLIVTHRADPNPGS